jgi:hypothetical protein
MPYGRTRYARLPRYFIDAKKTNVARAVHAAVYRADPAPLGRWKKGGGLLSGWLVPNGDGCYRSHMAKREQHGFDLFETRRRLEDWWLENFSAPVGNGVRSWPGGRSESIRDLLFEHWGEHGIGTLVEHDGVLYPALRCLEAPCPALGIALALLELCGYEETSSELQDIGRLKRAAAIGSISRSMRSELLAHAQHLAASLISRAVEHHTAGRPRNLLAQAVARHLREGGFTYRQIAAFMAATKDAARRRCAVHGDARSLSAVFAGQSIAQGTHRGRRAKHLSP